MIDLYRNIKQLREAKGLSQDELAKKTGYTSRSSIAKIEKGEVDLPRSKIIAFAEALDTTPAYLMGWEDDNKSSWQPSLTDKDEKELDKKVEDLLSAVDSDTGLMLDGQVMDDETREIFAMNLKNALRTTKLAAKAKYTPKKYRE